MKKLTPYEESEEISVLAQDFVKAIIDGRVSDPNGPYALTSSLRPDLHIGTSTAPLALLSRMERLKDSLLREEGTAQAYGIVRNLEQTVQSMDFADRVAVAPGGNLSPHNKHHIQRNLQESLPGMRETVTSLRATLKP